MGIVTKVQQVSITIAAGQTSGTATLGTAVNLLYASEHIGGAGNLPNTSTQDATKTLCSFVLTGPTTVTATRNTADASNALTITGTVISWASYAIKSIQSGSIVIGSGVLTNTAALTAVVQTNSAIQNNGGTFDTSGYTAADAKSSLQITSTTAVTATRGLSTGNLTTYFTVVEFNSGILNSTTQQITAVIAVSTATKTTAVTAVTAAQCMLFNGGFSYDSSGGQQSFADDVPYGALTSGTVFTATRVNASATAGNATVAATVVEFKAADVKSVNRGVIAIASSGTSNTATIAAVNVNYSIANWLGQTASGTNPVPAQTNTNLTLTSSTVLTATILTAAQTVSVSWEAIEFIPYTASGNMLLTF